MDTQTRQVAISRVFDAPRELVYRAFTDPDDLAVWWGPIGCSLPRELIEVDNRPGGFQRFVMVVADDPSLRIEHEADLIEVVEGRLLTGVLHVSGALPVGYEPFDLAFRFEFHDEPDGRTRLELRHELASGTLPEGWEDAAMGGGLEQFAKLDALLAVRA